MSNSRTKAIRVDAPTPPPAAHVKREGLEAATDPPSGSVRKLAGREGSRIGQPDWPQERGAAASLAREGIYQSLFNSTNDGFCIIEVLFDEDGTANDYRFLAVNPAFEKHTGLARVEGKRIREIVPNHEAHWFETYGRVALTGEATRFAAKGEALGRYFEVNAFRVGEPAERKVAVLFRDETARNAMQELLREKDEQLRKLADNLPDSAVYQYLRHPEEPVGQFTYLSAGIEKITGVSAEEALNNAGRLHALIPPEHQERLMLEEARCVRELADFDIEVPMRRADGAVRWMSIRSRPRRLANGGVVWDGVLTDITDRRQAEEAVERARDRSELLSRTLGRLLEAPDPQGVVEELCNAVRRFLKCEVFFNFLLDPASRRLRFNACGGVDSRLARKVENLELRQSLCGTAAQNGCRLHAEHLDTTQDPRSALVRSLGIRAYACHPLLGAEGKVMGTLSFGARDRDSFSAEDLDLMKAVTDHVAIAMLRRRSERARMEAEERLRTVLRAAGMGLWMHDLASGQLSWDARTQELFFVEPGNEPTLELFWGRLHPDDREPVRLEAKCALRENRMFALDHRVIEPRTGRVRWLHAEGRGVRDERGKPVRFDGISYDITERREFQAELERLVEERTARLQEMVGELEHFSYTITHDMKAPLRAMRGFAEVASQLCVKAEAKPFLEKISTAAERMDLLIRDALDYNQAVRRELPLEDVDTAALLRGILDSYPQFQSWKAHIQLQGSLPVVLGNEAGLTQCFSNLLGNAVKFVQPGHVPEVRVWAEVLADHEGWVRFWVEDKGIGIPEALLPRVFDMFTRGTREHEGTGIGLALVRKVVQRMGGRLGVESEEGKGSRFWLELKLGQAARPNRDHARAVSPGHSSKAVLYVEDEENDAVFMKRAFTAQGIKNALRIVSDGREAIDYLSGAGKFANRKEYPIPSLVVLDLNLPLVPGFGVLEWMRNHPDFARTPVVIFSSSSLEADRVKARQLEANEFIAKPSSGLDFGRVAKELTGKWLG